MNRLILAKLNEIEKLILSDNLPRLTGIREFGGADVIIKSRLDNSTRKWLENQPVVISFQDTEPRRRAVITKHSKELSWLFYQLRDIFEEEIDYLSKYDFFGCLAQSAIDYLENSKENALVIHVLRTAKGFCENVPENPNLPFFAYGLFKPGQLGYFRIKEFVKEAITDTVDGYLKEKDGIPLFSLGKDYSKVKGYLIYFKPGTEIQAYNRIIELEPGELYKWKEVKVNTGLIANVLVARNDKGCNDLEHPDEWDGKADPFFTDALDVAGSILNACKDFDWDYKELFRLQMAYTLLWSSIERYAGLRYHNVTSVTQRINSIANEVSFADSLKRHVKAPREVYRTTNSDRSTLNADNPKKSMQYYYQVRSNVVHRGKAAPRDFDTLRSSLDELLKIFRDVLDAAFHDN